MLLEKTVFAFLPIGNETINDRIHYNLEHLTTHIIHCINDNFKSGLQNYELFSNKIGEKIKFNTKNIVFEKQSKNLLCLDDEKIKIENQNPSILVEGKQINEFFGIGEFPMVNHYVIRIGNQNYSCYTISR